MANRTEIDPPLPADLDTHTRPTGGEKCRYLRGGFIALHLLLLSPFIFLLRSRTRRQIPVQQYFRTVGLDRCFLATVPQNVNGISARNR